MEGKNERREKRESGETAAPVVQSQFSAAIYAAAEVAADFAAFSQNPLLFNVRSSNEDFRSLLFRHPETFGSEQKECHT